MRAILLAILLASVVRSAPLDAGKVYDLLGKGKALTAAEAASLEARLQRKPDDPATRIQLLAYYVNVPASEAVKAARSRHIVWFTETDPQLGHGLYQTSGGTYRINCQGDPLADPPAAASLLSLWLQQLKKHNGDSKVRSHAIDAATACNPDEAERLLVEACDNAGLGRLYADAILGVTGASYTANDPSGSDAALRSSPFAEKARRALAGSDDKEMLAAAARAMLRDGAILWADGKLDWDYTPFGLALLRRAFLAGADRLTLVTLPLSLPARGERPPLTLRIGGNVMQGKMVSTVAPVYPRKARDEGIMGTVEFTAVVGLDGAIIYLRADSGPPELIPAAEKSVRQWRYSPTLLNGKPCYVQTRIYVRFQLGG